MNKNLPQLTVIGTGYVGLTSAVCFAAHGYNVCCVDSNQAKIEMLNNLICPIYEPGLSELMKENRERLRFCTNIPDGVKFGDIIFICVQTPPRLDGSADLSYVEEVAKEIALNMDSYKVIVDKSTVPVETGQHVMDTISKYTKHEFDVVSNPEFLREGCAISDSLYPDRIVVGVSSPRAESIMRVLYGPWDYTKLLITDIKSAELIKHCSNSFLAMKISFINSISRICELVGADVKLVADGMGIDKRIGEYFLNAGIGYGGSCFVKDVSAFIWIAKKLGYDFELLKMVEKVNRDQRTFFIKKVEKELWILKNKKIAVWGLSFKPDTDDIRNAPSLDIVKHLVDEGAIIRAHDPVAIQNFKHEIGENQSITYHTDVYDTVKDADVVLILTEWDEYNKVDLNKIKSMMLSASIIDGRNMFDMDTVRNLGFRYQCIGRN